jgi:predicted amidophosphoribosyltransferase
MASAVLEELVAVVVPPRCPSCRAALGAARLRLCPSCAAGLPWLPRGCCPRCALPGHRSGGCPAAGAAFGRAWAPLAYAGVARRLVAALKFRAALPLASVMAAHIAANLPRDLRGRTVVAVPPQRARLRRRGFDPAGVLARGVAERLGVPVVECLVRRDRGGRQVGTSRALRRREGRIAIEVCRAPPPRVLLVDDVHTTGATLDACARALRAGGCLEVVAVTYARTL